MKDKIKVMIVDDSASVRMVVGEIVDSNPDMEVLTTAPDPIIAERKLEKEWPDVMILDIEMPHKDGVTFLKEIMAKRPTPIIICSSLAERNARVTMEALSAGAVEIITKPKVGIKDFLTNSVTMITDAVRSAYNADLRKLKPKTIPKLVVEPKLSADAVLSPAMGKKAVGDAERIVAIGASAGGTQATEVVLKALPKETLPIVIVQHMPEKFTEAYASRLNNVCDIEVKEAANGDVLEKGHAFIAPGNNHVILEQKGKKYRIQIKEGPLVSRHRPSVDVLFRSVAKVAGKNALGIILTGMGDDGATGMKEMRSSGVKTIAQDEETCLVFGMPKEAIKRGGVDEVLALGRIPASIMRFYD